MVKRGKKFSEEVVFHGDKFPGVIDDEEILERRLPPKSRGFHGDAIPIDAFTRRDLTWTEGDGGASVVRRQFARDGNTGHRGERGAISARAGDIRDLTDHAGNRLWSIIDRPTPESPAHAEVQREPLGKKPSSSERDKFLEVWRGADSLLANLRRNDPHGEPQLKLVAGTGVEIHWRSGNNGTLTKVIQVESVSEAVHAYVASGILREEDAPKELRKLRRILKSEIPSS